jgi:transcription initiation factor TFIID subunit TAF12
MRISKKHHLLQLQRRWRIIMQTPIVRTSQHLYQRRQWIRLSRHGSVSEKNALLIDVGIKLEREWYARSIGHRPTFRKRKIQL